MKKIFIMSLLCVCFATVVAFAQEKQVAAIDAPDDDLEINVIKGHSKRNLGVIFNHSSHEHLDCFECHHRNKVKDTPEACSNCHKNTDPEAGGYISFFRAMHVKNPKRNSCLSCHVEQFPGDKDLTGCVNSSCHPTGLYQAETS